MTCDHEPERISNIRLDGSTVEIEAECEYCGKQLWGSVELMPVVDYSIGDRFEGPEGRYWTICNPRTPGPAGSPGLKIDQLYDQLEDRAVGVHLKAKTGVDQWFQQDQFESMVGDILEEL
ncbi:hypothetical protein [Halocatena halophila]|uniref:hypothetical protein n=1 Tax=Halocatena halophila TaxID=2814576 RepID=UPI002ED4499D